MVVSVLIEDVVRTDTVGCYGDIGSFRDFFV